MNTLNGGAAQASQEGREEGTLSGIKVLDLSGYIAGPYGCSLLADLGAEVIKVEPPQGDTLHKYPSTLKQEGRAFLGVNRSKRGIVIDLKQPEGLAVLERLVASADVFVHNFRPSVPPRLGIDYARLSEINPRLVYCAITGYGETGPLKDKAGYDQVLQSMTGICTFQGMGRDKPEIAYGSIVDYYAASMLAFSVSAALYKRETTGKGQSIGVSLLRSALTMQSARFIWAEGEPKEIDRDMRSGGITGIHPTRDGYLYISANTPHFWKDLCELTGLAALAADPRYDTVRKRAQAAEEIIPRLHAALQTRSALEWEELFGERVPCAAVRSIEDMFTHPQVEAEGIVEQFEHPLVGRYKGMGRPVTFSDTAGHAPFAAPALGQHSEEILLQHGYSDAEVERLKELKVIVPAPQQ
jgi:formyl-CoA transferase